MLRVKNWTTFQHYKDRRPVWIKLHTALLQNRAFMQMGDPAQALLLKLWILASDSADGSLPSLDDIRFRLHRPDLCGCALKALLDNDFLECSGSASELLAGCKHVASLEKRRDREEAEERRGRAGASEAGAVTASTPSAPGLITPEVVKVTWLTPYADAWTQKLEAEPAYGRLAKALAPLHKRYPAEQVLAHWRRYLDVTAPAFITPEAFAQKFGAYAPDRNPTKAEANAGELLAWLQETEAAEQEAH